MLVYGTAVVVTMIKVLMDNREPAKTMAWALLLWVLPLVGIILYYFFGQNTRKEKVISQRSLDELTKRSMLEYVEQKGLSIPEAYRPLMRLYANQSMALPFKDNEVEIYVDGYEFFPALLSAISKAKHHIHIESYIFADDALGRLVADTLIDKAGEGVEVRVVFDDVGSWRSRNAFYEKMRKAGVIVRAFMPVRFPALTSKANYRNHRKLCVIDGQVGFIGGMNIALRYVKGTGGQPWRDTHLRVIGGAVYAIQRAFLTDWYFVDRTLISGRAYYPDTGLSIHNNCLAQVVTSSPVSSWPEIMQGYMRILMQSRHYVYMESPYFLPTEPILFAMKTAAVGGVDVRLIMPWRGDAYIVEWAGRSYVMEAIEAGVKVYLYKAGFIHSKMLICDDNLCCCGSANIDFRSFEHDFEANIFFYDTDMAMRMKQVFMADLARSVAVEESGKLAHRTFLKRFWESLLRLLSPLL